MSRKAKKSESPMREPQKPRGMPPCICDVLQYMDETEISQVLSWLDTGKAVEQMRAACISIVAKRLVQAEKELDQAMKAANRIRTKIDKLKGEER